MQALSAAGMKDVQGTKQEGEDGNDRKNKSTCSVFCGSSETQISTYVNARDSVETQLHMQRK